jgi:hypothetical protein
LSWSPFPRPLQSTSCLRRDRVGDVPDGIVSILERAKAYPYDIPKSCYGVAGGDVLPLIGVDLSSASRLRGA